MPAGDLCIVDYTAELRTTLMGGASNYAITEIDITSPELVSNDLRRLLTDGDFQGAQYAGPQYVSLTMNVTGSTEANLIANLDTLKTAWAKAASDITFVLRIPQWGKRSLSGRPFRFEVPVIDGQQRIAKTIFGVRAQFKAGTPTWTQL